MREKMKKILGLVGVLTAMALGMNVQRAAGFTSFTAGHIVIFRVGDGTQALTNTQNSVFLDEYTTNGTYVQSLPMPTAWYGANAPLISFGSGFAQGEMTLSQDGRFLVVPGFGAPYGYNTNYTLYTEYASNQVPRVVGLVDGQGNINTTTVQTNAFETTEEIRSAASTDGTNIWYGGDTSGIKATTVGSSLATQVEKSVTNIRYVNIYSNQLYFTASTGIRSTTNIPLPTTTLGLPAILSGTFTNGSVLGTAPFGFVMFNLKGGSIPDTLYTCEGTISYPSEGTGVVLKYSLIGGTNWVNSGSLGAGNACGITGVMNVQGSQTNVTLFITNGGTASATGADTGVAKLSIGVDSSGFNGNPGAAGDLYGHTVSLTPGGVPFGSVNIRGVAMAPNGNQPLINGANAGKVSVGPIYGINAVGSYGGPFSPGSFTYSVANFGTASISYSFINGSINWLTGSPSSGTIVPGGSLTVNVSVNATANSLPAGLHTGNVIFNPGGVGLPVSIQVNAFTITPSTNYTAAGPVGGPFVPASQVYVLSNATGSALNWTLNTAQPWSSLSATTGSLAGAATTNITYSFNNAANSLAVGIYGDSITFSNVTGSALQDTINVTLQVGFGMFEDFSTYTQNANLVGQNGWLADDDLGQTPYQVANGVLNILGSGNGLVCTAGEEPVKDWSSTTVTDTTQYVYAGMLITVSNAVVTAAPPFAFEVEDEVKQKEPVSYEDDAGSPVANGAGGYVWAARKSTGATWTIGTQARTYGVQYMVIDVGDIANSNCWIFVNPPDGNVADLFAMTPDAWDLPASGGAGEDAGGGEGAGGWIWGQYGAAAVCQPGFTVSKFAMSTNYADVYNFLAGAAPPPANPFATWQTNYFTSGELANPAFSGPNADPLGKGMSNTNQFLAGFNPTNAAAYLHITSVSKTNSSTDIRVDYLGASGDSTYSPGFASRTNVLEFTAGTGNGSYNSNGFASAGVTDILSGGVGLGTLTNMVDPGGATNKPSRYYRVRVLVP
jgi:hypothetical protein